jgi:surface protein
MAEAKVTFIYDCNNMIIQCKKEERMKDICQRYSTKLGINLNLLVFLYGGQQINTQLTFNEISPNENDIKIIVIKSEQDELICPKCGSNIIVNTEKIDEIVNSMNNIKETIIGIKVMIDNVIKTSMQNLMNIQLKNINLLLNNVNDDFNKISEKIKNLIKDNTFTNYQQNKNVIRGLIYINTTDINKDIVLFNTDANNDIDVFINNQKINVIKDTKKWKYKFSKEGNYILEIIFNYNITNMNGFFEECTNIISLDLSNFNTSNAKIMRRMFDDLNCIELDLSSFDTSNVDDCLVMFQNIQRNCVIKISNKFTKCREQIHQDVKVINIDEIACNNFNNCEKCNGSKEALLCIKCKKGY